MCYLPEPNVIYKTCSKQIKNFQQVYSFLSNLSEDHFCYSFYFGLIFELLIKQIFLLRHSFLRCLSTSVAFALSLSLRGIILETNTLLLSDLHCKATSIMSLLISLVLFSFFRSFMCRNEEGNFLDCVIWLAIDKTSYLSY